MGAAYWGDRYAELKKIAQEHGRISQKLCGGTLARWIAVQQKAIKEGRLPPEKIDMLMTIKGVQWYGRSKTAGTSGSVAVMANGSS
jgi:hypothetical protein